MIQDGYIKTCWKGKSCNAGAVDYCHFSFLYHSLFSMTGVEV